MGGFVKGQVVAVQFPFTDFSTFQKRPALILAALEDHNDLILCMITTRRIDSSAIEISSTDFLTGNLTATSYVRPNRLFTVAEEKILGTVGRLQPKIMQLVTDKLFEILS